MQESLRWFILVVATQFSILRIAMAQECIVTFYSGTETTGTAYGPYPAGDYNFLAAGLANDNSRSLKVVTSGFEDTTQCVVEMSQHYLSGYGNTGVIKYFEVYGDGTATSNTPNEVGGLSSFRVSIFEITECKGHYGTGGDDATQSDPDLEWCCYSCNCKDLSDKAADDLCPSDGILYENAGPIVPAKDSAPIGAVPIRDCMRYRFDVEFSEWCTASWCSVFHVGNDDTSGTQAVQRMPGMWLQGTGAKPGFHIAGTTVASGNPYKNPGPSGGLALDTVYSLDITYANNDDRSSGSFRIVMNDEVVYENEAWGPHCVSGQTCHIAVADQVPINIGQPWYGPLVGTVSNIGIYDCDIFTDLCANVECDDADACTTEYCNPENGQCVSTAVNCDDEDACTVDTCDSSIGCVNTDKDCADGNICNGEEACVEGECVSPNDFECPRNFECNVDAQSCLRDCSLFAIDGYLTDCSVEFDAQANDLVALEDGLNLLSAAVTGLDQRVAENTAEIETGAGLIADLQSITTNLAEDAATNAENIAANTGDIATNTEDIATNTGNVATNTADIATNGGLIGTNADGVAENNANIATNGGLISTNTEGVASNLETIGSNTASIATNVGSIGDLEERLEKVEDRVYSFAPVAEQGEGDGSNSLNGPDEVGSQSVGIINIPDLSRYHNELIVFLVALNALLVLSLCCIGACYCKDKQRTIFVHGASKQYSPVQVYSSADDEIARLNGDKH